MPISNEIFETFRVKEKAKKQIKAIRFLFSQGFTILDKEGKVINKENYKK